MPEQPPKWAMRFLERTCSPKFLDELQGDLLELFYRDVERLGGRRARKRFIRKALLSPRWHRLPKPTYLQPTVMYRNHLKVAFRYALRHRSVSIIQALGLTLGLAAVFFIGLFIRHEMSFDQMHVNRDNLYRVLHYNPENGARGQATSSRLGATLAEEFPFLSLCRFGNDPVKIGEVDPLLVEDFYWADSTYFELFTFDFLYGNPTTCLKKMNSLVITESVSRRFFGLENPLGRTIPVKVYDGDQEFLMEITAVVKDPSKFSHIQFQALGTMADAENLYGRLVRQWGFSWLRTYVYIPDDRLAEVEAGIPHLIQKNFGDDPPPGFGITFQSFGDVYLHSQDIPKNTFRGNFRNLQIFGSIGILILIISLMNYVNLSTARAVIRMKEVGIRKTLGSRTVTIAGQFIVESVLFTLTGGMVAAILVLIGLPYLNRLLELDLSLSILSWMDGIVLVLALFLLGLLAGIIPAVVMARLPVLSDPQSPVQFKLRSWSGTRKLFVGTQYLVTLVLMVATFVIYRQYQYLRHFDLGFDAEQLLHVPVDDRQVQQRLDLLKEKTAVLPGVTGVAVTGEDLPSALNNTWGLNWNGSGLEEGLDIDIVGVDRDYFGLLGINFVAGHNFRYDYATDSARTVVLNAQALKMMNWEGDIIGHTLRIGEQDRTVIGVVEDHHNRTLHTRIVPLAYFIYPPGFRVSPDNLLVRVETGDLNALLAQMEAVWKEFSSDPFEYNFVDEAFATAYASEQRFSTLVGFFTFIAVAISLIGLFGLVSFMVQRKLKEISIRRVLGATQMSLLGLLGKDFFVVFVAATLIAIPLAVYVINSWLTGFAYRVQIGGLIPLLAVVLCLGISVMVLLYHLQRAARTNPAEVLSID
ncbi:MAG: ABC transporter permease [Saprospiraceae bacterium]|nr:ABC transporter permease [Lewinella sp.]